jgi:hypothetical protein
MTLAELIATGIAEEQLTRSTVYALMITRAIDVPGETRPPLGARRRRSSGVRERISRSLAG